MPVPYDDLDPGIREVVRFLTESGFTTCDSGDGRSKFEDSDPMGCANPIPHVAVLTTPESLVDTCDRMRAHLRGEGVDVQSVAPEEGVSVQGSYDPSADRGVSAVVVLYGLDDEGLKAARARRAFQEIDITLVDPSGRVHPSGVILGDLYTALMNVDPRTRERIEKALTLDGPLTGSGGRNVIEHVARILVVYLDDDGEVRQGLDQRSVRDALARLLPPRNQAREP